jgi:quinol monooxygenase YgiN
MAKAVQIPWYATGFRGDSLEAALSDIAEVALKYGATGYAVYRGHDDRYKFLQVANFESKSDWNSYWNGPEFTRFRTVTSGWWQVPVLYSWHDVSAAGAMPANGHAVEGAA